MIQPTLDFSARGRELKDKGIAQVDSHTPEDYKEEFKAKVLSLPFGRLFTSDDIIELVGMPPNHVNSIGALMHGLSKRNFIRHSSYTTSKRESRHAAVIRVWERI